MKNLEKMTWEETIEKFAGKLLLLRIHTVHSRYGYNAPDDFDIVIAPETEEEMDEMDILRFDHPEEYHSVFIPYTLTYQGWKTYRGLDGGV